MYYIKVENKLVNSLSMEANERNVLNILEADEYERALHFKYLGQARTVRSLIEKLYVSKGTLVEIEKR